MERKISLSIDNPNRVIYGTEENTNTHHYIVFDENPRRGTNTEAGFLIIDYYFGNKQPRNKWTKEKKQFVVSGQDSSGQIINSLPINYLIIGKFIRENQYFDRLHFNLYNMECSWMDTSLDYKFDTHFTDESGESVAIIDGIPEQNYGSDYPIKPRLDREGRSFSTLLPLLLKRIMKSRTLLITNSHLALTNDWFLDLRTLINDSISVIEITLNQLYIKAEYDPLPGWTFDREKLGYRNARRFRDKLGWIYQISGKNLNAEEYTTSCDHLREIRNHLLHFDPPSIVVTVEEMTGWLNEIIDVGFLIIKIRMALAIPVSQDLINFILQKNAVFVPVDPTLKRISVSKSSAGYRSSTWKQ